MSFKQYVTELFDKTVAVHQTKDFGEDGGVWSFTLNGAEYHVGIAFVKLKPFSPKAMKDNEIIKKHNGAYDIAFYAIADNVFKQKTYKFDLIGGVDSLKVFATVIKVVKDYFKGQGKVPITFSAKEPSRIKLYSKFAKILDPSYTTIHYDGDTIFIMDAEIK